MIRDYQARLGMKQDSIKRKLVANRTELAGIPTDCIRISLTLNDEGDILTSKVREASVINVVFPPLKDVPIRMINSESGEYKITSAINAFANENQQVYLVTCPRNCPLTKDDLLVRVMLDSEMDKPIVIVFKVADCFGTFGSQALIGLKYQLVVYEENLSTEIENAIIDFAKRRLNVGY